MRITVALFAAACGCGGASHDPPTAGSSPPPPPRARAIEPAELTTFTVDTTSGFKASFERDDGKPYKAQIKRFEPKPYSYYDVLPWDPSWATELGAFEAKLAEDDYIDTYYRYEVTRTSATDDAWEFRGRVVHKHLGEPEPTFLLVRTIGNKRFLCKARNVKEPGALDAAVANCRSAKL